MKTISLLLFSLFLMKWMQEKMPLPIDVKQFTRLVKANGKSVA